MLRLKKVLMLLAICFIGFILGACMMDDENETAVAQSFSETLPRSDISALLLEVYPNATPAEINARMMNTARSLPEMMPNQEQTLAARLDADVENQTIDFYFTKTDDEGEPLSGAVFSLYAYDENAEDWEVTPTATVTSQAETGLVRFEDLTGSRYKLVETTAPTGFARPTGYWVITISGTGEISIESSDANQPIFTQGECPSNGDAELTVPLGFEIPSENHEIFADPESGVLWRVLVADDGNGNALIITEGLHSAGTYPWTGDHAFHSAGFNPTSYYYVTLRGNMQRWANRGLWSHEGIGMVGPTLRSLALDFEFQDDVGNAVDRYNSWSAGLEIPMLFGGGVGTISGNQSNWICTRENANTTCAYRRAITRPTGEPGAIFETGFDSTVTPLFSLSRTELATYFVGDGQSLATPGGNWWTRSTAGQPPQGQLQRHTLEVSGTSGAFASSPRHWGARMRPAMWIRLPEAQTCPISWILANQPEEALQDVRVDFDANGGIPDAYRYVESGLTLGANMPSEPNRTGYTFTGWFTQRTGGEAFISTTPVPSDITVFARWEANANVRVDFDANGGTSDAYRNVQGGLTVGANMPTNPTRTGYTFTGWFTQRTGGEAFTSTTPVSSNVTVFARWEANANVRVDFDANGGTPDSHRNVQGGLTVGANMPTNPTRTGYTFTGWFTELTGGTEFTSTTPVPSNITVFARWESNANVRVDFDANGGTPDSHRNVQGGLTVGANMPTNPTRTGYTFTGWFTEPTGGEAFTSTTPVTANITVFARWEANANVRVDFDANGGTPDAYRYVESGLTIGANMPNDPTRVGYEFVGWFTQREGGEIFTSTTPVTSSMVVYARWIPSEDPIIELVALTKYLQMPVGTTTPVASFTFTFTPSAVMSGENRISVNDANFPIDFPTIPEYTLNFNENSVEMTDTAVLADLGIVNSDVRVVYETTGDFLANANWTRPGHFIFTVAEVAQTNELPFEDGYTEKMIYDTTEFELHVIVSNVEGELTVVGVYAWHLGSDWDGNLENVEGKVTELAFLNTFLRSVGEENCPPSDLECPFYSLMISKQVMGDWSSATEDFTFNLQLMRHSLDESTTFYGYIWTFTNTEGWLRGARVSFPETGDTFTLRHNQALVLDPILIGTGVAVTEVNYAPYTPSITLIVGGADPVQLNNATTGWFNVGEGTNSAEFLNTLNSVPITGIIANHLHFTLMAFAFIGFFMLIIIRVKRSIS